MAKRQDGKGGVQEAPTSPEHTFLMATSSCLRSVYRPELGLSLEKALGSPGLVIGAVTSERMTALNPHRPSFTHIALGQSSNKFMIGRYSGSALGSGPAVHADACTMCRG